MNEQPSRFHATPAEIDAFLRKHFAEDVLLNYYQAVGDEVLDEALTHGRQHRGRKELEQAKHVYLAGMADVMDEIWDYRYYPAKLPQLSSYNLQFNPPRAPHPGESAKEEIPEFTPCPKDSPHPPHRYIGPKGRALLLLCEGIDPGTAEPLAPAPEPQDTPCYRTKTHEPHDWLKGRRKAHCPGHSKETS